MTTWTHDPSHYPEPMTPLSADVWFGAMGHGIRAAARELRAPFGGFETMTAAGGWAYEQELEDLCLAAKVLDLGGCGYRRLERL